MASGTAVSDAMLEIDGLVRHFGGVPAVDDISFDLERGRVLGFIGPNGAGKTTTMRILATLETPQGGDARIGGYSVVDDPEQVRRMMGFMPDYAGVYANTTVEEYLDFFARAHDLRGESRRKAVEHIIEFMSLGDLRDRHVESLSKGLKQRVALGRAIVHNPEVLILDEPAANLDPRARIEFRTLIRELAADGKTILLSSHILTELSEMCDAVTVIERGKILATGSVEDILQRLRPRRKLSVRLAGSSERLERFLVEQPGVTNVHEAGPCLEFEFEGGDDEQVQLVGRVIGAGFPVLEFAAHSAGLEDLFIEITEGRVQ
jgi:ABC-2 type transport system ATP-binding protein